MAEKKNTFWNAFLNGLLFENPTFVLMVGMCPTLAVTTAASNAIGMGLSTTVVFIVVIASFVTMVEMALKAYLPDLSATLGLYIPLIVVNCIIFARAESFAFKNGPVLALGDGLGMGFGFTLAITILASIREIFGAGTIFGLSIMGEGYKPMSLLTAPAGGFLTLGILLILVNLGRKKVDAWSKARKEAEAV